MRQLPLVAVKLAVSAALLYFALSKVDLPSLGARLANLAASWIFVAIAIGLIQVLLMSVRWRAIVRTCGVDIPFRESLRFNMIGTFFGQVLPSTVGGDLARVWLLARSGSGWRVATYSVLVDRYFGLMALAVLVAAGLHWSLQLIADPAGRIVLLTIGIGALLGGAGFLIVGPWLQSVNSAIIRPIADVAALTKRLATSDHSFSLIAACSLAIHLLTAAVAWSVARAVAARLGFFDACLLVLPVMLIATVPISIAGWGVRETALVLAFSYAGLPQGDGLVVSVLLGSVLLVVGLIGGVVWLSTPGSPRLAADLEAERPHGYSGGG